MSTKHTPGPWVVDAENNLIHASDDRHTVICSFHGSMRNPSVAADARLIATAPELLEALKMLLRYTVACEAMLNAKPAGQIEIARAAIAKATGEQQ